MDSFSLLQTILPERTSIAILDLLPNGMLIVDAFGCIVRANRAAIALFAQHGGRITGMAIDSLIPMFRMPPARTPAELVLTAIGIRSDGSSFPLVMKACRPADGSCIVIKEIQDVSAISDNAESQSTLAGVANIAPASYCHSTRNTAHELRTPLGAIVAYASLLLTRLPGGLTPRQELHVSVIKNTGARMLTLLNDLVDIARADAGAIGVRLAPESCMRMVGEVADMMRPLANEKDLQLVVELPRDDVVIVTDRLRVIQILTDLVGNAIKFTARGKVRIALEHGIRNGRKTVDIGVIDTGPGIKREDVHTLFQEFFQLDGLPLHRTEGAGLGLYLSQQLATLLGGRVLCHSVIDLGSTFTLQLSEERRRGDGDAMSTGDAVAGSEQRAIFGSQGN